MLGPNALHLCLSASSQDNNAIDNSRMYMLRLESNDTFIDVPGSGTVLLITNDDGKDRLCGIYCIVAQV